MSFALALLVAAGAPTVAQAPPPQASAVGIARARIVAPAEVRRMNGRLELRAGDSKAPTQVHRTKRLDGGETADFY